MALILVVDDSPLVREMVGMVLRAAAHEVCFAEDGPSALTAAAERAPEVVVCDLKMPGMSGIDVVRALRSVAPLSVALILTDADDVNSCARAMKEGALGYVLKSSFHDLLLHEVDAALESRRLRLKNHELEEANRAYQRELEAKVAQKTAEVLKLQELKSQAEKMVALGTLVAGVAHEVNNPLAVVKSDVGFLNQLTRSLEGAAAGQPLSPEAAQDAAELPDVVTELTESIGRIERIVKALRRIAHPGGTSVLCMVSDALRDAELFCRPVLEAGAELVRNLESTSLLARLSRDDLTTVLSNLIGNAAQALPGGKGRIEVSARRREDGGLILQVSDTGCGIPSENLQRVCDPFFTTKPPGKGTGLGLSLVQQIISSAGGQLRIESAVGRGTSIHLELPPPTTDARPGSEASSRFHA